MASDGRAQADGSDESGALPLDPQAAVPLYRQLLADLKRRIFAGQFDRLGQLPSEARIERSYGVSRITVRRALQELEQLGLVERRQGRATRLAPQRLDGPAEAELEAELATMLSLGLRTESELLEVGLVPSPPELAERLELAPGAPVQRSLRLRRMAGQPFCSSLAYLPAALARPLPRQALEGEPLPLLLVRSGVVIGRVEQSVAAVAASAELAKRLAVEPRAPLLLIERLFRDARGRPAALVFLHFRADRYRYGMTFRTDSQSASTALQGLGDLDAGK